PGQINSLSSNTIWSVLKDRNNFVWIGTNDALNRYNLQTGEILYFRHDPNNLNSLSHDRVRYLYEDSAGIIWMGTNRGLTRYNDGEMKQYLPDQDNPASLPGNYVWSIIRDTNGILWVGTHDGLARLDEKSQSFTNYFADPTNPRSLVNNTISSLALDKDGNLWIGSRAGLHRYNPSKDDFDRFLHDPEDDKTINDNRIRVILPAKNGGLWLGTNAGINYFDPKTKQFTAYTEEDGLCNNTIYGLLEDDDGYLWMSTNRGLAKFDPKTKIFKNYDAGDGLQSNEFNGGAYFKDSQGLLYFGGINGLNIFKPEEIRDNPNIPQIVLTGFNILGRPAQFDRSVSAVEEIRLSYKENFITFAFAALEFTKPEKNQFAYKLEGFNEEWIYSGNENRVNYTNLDGGKYLFRVKGSNNDGIWNEKGLAVKLTVKPPFWKTKFAYLIYFIVIGISAAGIYKWRSEQMKKELARREKLMAKDRELADRFRKNDVVAQIRQNSDVLLHNIESIEQTMEGIRTRAHDLSNASENTVTATEEMSANIVHIQNNVETSFQNVRVSTEYAQKGDESANAAAREIDTIRSIVNESTGAVALMEKKAAEIEEMVKVIRNIDDQTNLLSLNAAIEAARAGDAGRGFAVVAQVVQKLSNQTSDATKKISAMIKEIQDVSKSVSNKMKLVTKEVAVGVNLVEDTRAMLSSITESISNVENIMSSVAESMQEQTRTTNNITEQSDIVRRHAQDTDSDINQTAETLKKVAEIAERLNQIVQMFDMDNILKADG
ncbi:MAG TPA: hypothetical protein ENN84_06555, partial [Candidatus Marinimicrobia bacterium]|nr:hypothetical protein [Candidatus Neomarinimicrobiota bacterium]